MDLRITVRDENNDVLYERDLYRDGSDSEAVGRIADALYWEFGPAINDEETLTEAT